MLDVPLPHMLLTKKGSSGSGFFTTRSNLPPSRKASASSVTSKLGGFHRSERHGLAVEIHGRFAHEVESGQRDHSGLALRHDNRVHRFDGGLR